MNGQSQWVLCRCCYCVNLPPRNPFSQYILDIYFLLISFRIRSIHALLSGCCELNSFNRFNRFLTDRIVQDNTFLLWALIRS